MKVTTLIPNKIITIDDFLTPEECENLINLSENLIYEKAKIDIGKVVTEVRNNERVFYESKDLAKELFEKAKTYLVPKIGNSIVLELNELFRFYKYEKGHYFKGHQDGNFIRNDKEASYFTFLIYLNENYEGGETNFIEHKITPKTGTLLVFFHKLYHEGNEVTEGKKYVLRTDVMYRLEG